MTQIDEFDAWLAKAEQTFKTKYPLTGEQADAGVVIGKAFREGFLLGMIEGIKYDRGWPLTFEEWKQQIEQIKKAKQTKSEVQTNGQK